MNNTPRSPYLMVLFSHPGPVNVAAELQNLIPYLKSQNGFSPAKGLKIKVTVESIGKATDFAKIGDAMRAWLEGENPGVVFKVTHVGINVQGNRFKFFQAAWVVASSKNEELAGADISDMQAAINHALASSQVLTGPACGSCGKQTLLLSEAEVTELFGLNATPQEDRQKASLTAYRCMECKQISCLQCAFTTSKSLNLGRAACPNCHSTNMVTLQDYNQKHKGFLAKFRGN